MEVQAEIKKNAADRPKPGRLIGKGEEWLTLTKVARMKAKEDTRPLVVPENAATTRTMADAPEAALDHAPQALRHARVPPLQGAVRARPSRLSASPPLRFAAPAARHAARRPTRRPPSRPPAPLAHPRPHPPPAAPRPGQLKENGMPHAMLDCSNDGTAATTCGAVSTVDIDFAVLRHARRGGEPRLCDLMVTIHAAAPTACWKKPGPSSPRRSSLSRRSTAQVGLLLSENRVSASATADVAICHSTCNFTLEAWETPAGMLSGAFTTAGQANADKVAEQLFEWCDNTVGGAAGHDSDGNDECVPRARTPCSIRRACT